MPRPKGSKNKPKVINSVKGKNKQMKGASSKFVKEQQKVLPNTNFETEEPEHDYKIIQCPYMGPDADDSEQFVKSQYTDRRKWNDDDFAGNFSISTDSLY